MRYETSVTSLSWIPSEAVTGSTRLAFDAGIGHYDDPPPSEIADVEQLQAADRFRFANVLRAWIEVGDDGTITDAGYSGGGLMGATTVRLGALRYRFQAFKLDDLQRAPEHRSGSVCFSQTVGGRTGVPAPRRVTHAPYVQFQAPLVWTTLELTMSADGTAEHALTGASPFPRHWVYDHAGQLAGKSGLTNFKDWYAQASIRQTPWGDEDSPALVTAVESALERALSVQLMHGAGKPSFRSLRPGETLVRQGEPGTELFLVLDGVIRVEHNQEQLAEYGPGAILGERSHLEGGVRTSTLVAVTACRVASVPGGALDPAALTELAGSHRREDAVQGNGAGEDPALDPADDAARD
jgi:Cyclic nucleotide-binding domain